MFGQLRMEPQEFASPDAHTLANRMQGLQGQTVVMKMQCSGPDARVPLPVRRMTAEEKMVVERSGGIGAHGAILVYNRDHWLIGEVRADEPGFHAIRSEINRHGVFQQKAYFKCKIAAGGRIEVDIGNMLPLQDW